MGKGAGEMRSYDEPGERDAYVVTASETVVAPGEIETRRISVEGDESGVQEIREEIEHTRAEMGETVDALQQKLDPQHLKEQAKETVRDATIGKAEQVASSAGQKAKGTGSSMLETIKQNPMPAALTAVGVGWLFMSSRGSSSGGGQMVHEAQGKVGQAAGQAQQVVGQAASQAQHTVGQAGGQVQQKAGQVADQAQHTVGQTAGQAQQQVQRARSQFPRMLQQNPLGIGAAAVALGAAVGAALPETRQEEELLGPMRDKALQRAKSVAQDTQQQVQSVAQEAQKTAQQEAQKQHLTG